MIVKHHSCGVVVFTRVAGVREYLLLKYPEGHFDFVKGHREEIDENELATAKRELVEETGMSEIKILPGFMTTMNYEYIRGVDKHIKQVDYFLGEVNSKEIVISDEHLEFIWLPYAETMSKITYDNGRDILVAAEAFIIAHQ